MASCGRLPAPRTDQSAESVHEGAIPLPATADILVVLTQGSDRWTFVTAAANQLWSMIRRLSTPPDGRHRPDFRFGVVTAKLDIPGVCPPWRGQAIPNDARLRIPATHLLAPPPSWPLSWASKWPPRWPYLTSDMANDIDLSELVHMYVVDMASDGDCNVNQYMEAAARAIDGRNGDFVRSDSLLVIVLIADQEDCSTKNDQLWDPSLWSCTAGGPYFSADARCLEPPSDLLYSVQDYVTRVSSAHRNGSVLLAAAGLDASPEWTSVPCKRPVSPCTFIVSTPRLAALPRGLTALQNSRLEGFWIDACRLYADKSLTELQSLADHILARLAR